MDFEEKPFTENFKVTYVLNETKNFKVSQITCDETDNKYFIFCFKNQKGITKDRFVNSIGKVLDITNNNYPLFLQIVGFEYNNQITNCPTIFYEYSDIRSLQEIVAKNELIEQGCQFKIISGVAFLIKFLITHKLPVGPLSFKNIYINKNKDPIFMGVHFDDYSANQASDSFCKILIKLCSEVLDESFNSINSSYDENYCFVNQVYSQMHSILEPDHENDNENENDRESDKENENDDEKDCRKNSEDDSNGNKTSNHKKGKKNTEKNIDVQNFSHFEEKIAKIIDVAVSIDLRKIIRNLSEYDNDVSIMNSSIQNVELFLSKIFTESLSEQSLLQLYRKSNQQQRQINELSSTIENLTEELREMSQIIFKLQNNQNQIQEVTKKAIDLDENVKQKLSILKSLIDPIHRIEIPLDNSRNGIFAYLINNQTSKFDRDLVPSQSSGDVYCIIDENNPGNFSSGSGDYEWVQFEFKEPISLVSFMIRSAHRAFLKTWNLVAYDDHENEIILYQTKDNPSLNGKNKEVILNVKAYKAQTFRLEKLGENWAGTNFMRIQQIEFYSDDPKYLGGVFKTLLEEAGGDPHKADVFITSSNFDFQRFHKLSPSRSLCTLYDQDSPWFQVELTKGFAIVHGYRIQILDNFPIYKWQLIGSNDKENWDVIHEVSISQNDCSSLMIFECNSKLPYSTFRFLNTMENKNDDLKLRLKHFDIFGIYLINEPSVALE
ncbi:hypothetical protein TRFO_33868 [Tritrichomonas foetus]|uniref:Uncharacterized protein n=1 Tax=Tritrichomonas foetus TaxID=1144522 RepID=A0A1J4JKK7_9EUKA|nr:hypothetical protein TRFO_33868 [Tritrichomonas foetus]|eukprot:OHS99634.1 hypothetical protein TRFO_33868 [Tritrichomonas foetus]